MTLFLRSGCTWKFKEDTVIFAVSVIPKAKTVREMEDLLPQKFSVVLNEHPQIIGELQSLPVYPNRWTLRLPLAVRSDDMLTATTSPTPVFFVFHIEKASK